MQQRPALAHQFLIKDVLIERMRKSVMRGQSAIRQLFLFADFEESMRGGENRKLLFRFQFVPVEQNGDDSGKKLFAFDPGVLQSEAGARIERLAFLRIIARTLSGVSRIISTRWTNQPPPTIDIHEIAAAREEFKQTNGEQRLPISPAPDQSARPLGKPLGGKRRFRRFLISSALSAASASRRIADAPASQSCNF